jgi:putative ABC transport system ATP-binding protein
MRGARIGLLFQSANLFAHLTVTHNVTLAQRLAGNRRGTPAATLLDSLGVAGRARAYPGQLSGGELARAGLAVALANDPAVLLADEPTGELDARTGTEIISLFQRLNSDGTTIVVVTHDEDLANAARHNVHMRDGRIVAP